MKRLPWRDSGEWLVGDTHMHYRNVGLPGLAEAASRHCDFIAVTSHIHRTDFFEAQPSLIEETRAERPGLVIINGAEWNPPIGKHATVMVPGGAGGMPLLRELIERFDRRVSGIAGREKFLEGLRFLGAAGDDDVLRPTVILNHPGDDPPFTCEDLRDGLMAGPALAGFSGGGGHAAWQGFGGDAPANAWAAEVGGVYDTLIGEGLSPVMIADGDFHSHVSEGGSDFWPGEFTRTFVLCPERSERGVFAGIRSGGAYFVLGPLVDSIDLRASSAGEWAGIGEELAAGAGPVELELRMRGASAVDRVDVIGNPSGPAEVLARLEAGSFERDDGDLVARASVAHRGRRFFLRVRGRGVGVKPVVGKSGVMWFYTNAVRVSPAGGEG